MSAPFPLAIVVPAYKQRFLQAALASIAAQTDQRFQLYVFDDASPQDLVAIYRGIFPSLSEDRIFVRFAENLGGSSLVKQWNRCVTQTRGEPWVWLFSDDDIADPNCVAAFYEACRTDQQRGEQPSVYRFNTVIIDAKGLCVAVSPPHPTREDQLQFVYHRMLRQRNSFAPDHIFARAAFDQCGGFVDFPFALGSDDASWITFSQGSPIRTIQGPYVYIRISGENTSNLTGANAVPKLLGLLEFTLWLENGFGKCVFPPGEVPTSIDLGRLIRCWFLQLLNDVPKLLSYSEIKALATAAYEKGHFTKRNIKLRLCRSNLCFVVNTLIKSSRSWLD